jgi:N-methylhydantoinase A/oxoprolinase/acetone carboxylase beta subunit
MDWPAVKALLAEMEDEGRRVLAEAGVPAEQVTSTRSADMRLYGQAHQIAVPLPAGRLDEAQGPAVLAAFERAYEALYKRRCPDVAVEAISWRVRVTGPQPGLELRRDMPVTAGPARAVGEARKGARRAYFPEVGGMVETPVYDRYVLRPGDRFTGPAVVEERESTAVIGAGGEVEVDEWGNLVVKVESVSARQAPARQPPEGGALP